MIINKTAIKILAAAMLATSVLGCDYLNLGQNKEKTKEATQSLMTINNGVDSVYNLLVKSYETFQPEEMDRALEGFNTFLANAAKSLGEMDMPEECQQLRQSLSEKVEAMRNIASSDAKEQVRIYKIPDADFTDELRQQWDKISSSVEEKVSDFNSKVSNALDAINKKSQDSQK